DGRVLAGYRLGSQSYIYDPATDSWSSGANLLNGDINGEETWVKLPDGSILTYEIGGSGAQTGQRYLPWSNQWVSAGSVPVQLQTNGGNSGIHPEIGPAVLLPDGRVFWVGATSHTATYNLYTGYWN